MSAGRDEFSANPETILGDEAGISDTRPDNSHKRVSVPRTVAAYSDVEAF